MTIGRRPLLDVDGVMGAALRRTVRRRRVRGRATLHPPAGAPAAKLSSADTRVARVTPRRLAGRHTTEANVAAKDQRLHLLVDPGVAAIGHLRVDAQRKVILAAAVVAERAIFIHR